MQSLKMIQIGYLANFFHEKIAVAFVYNFIVVMMLNVERRFNDRQLCKIN